MQRFLSVLCSFGILLSGGCLRHSPLIPKDRVGDGMTRRYYQEYHFDRYGRPVFTGELSRFDTKPGMDYYVVDADSRTGNCLRAFQVSVISPEEWDQIQEKSDSIKVQFAADGFGFGAVSKGTTARQPHNLVGGEALVIGVVVLVFAAGGFIYCVEKGTAELFEVVRKPMVKGVDLLTGYMRCTWDKRGRILNLTQYSPVAVPQELIRAEYRYGDGGTDPTQIQITSVPEKRSSVITLPE
jgi:hypothetical protein